MEERAAWAQFLTLAVMLFGGALAGSGVERAVAPESDVAHLVGFVLLPLSLGLGLVAWFYLALAITGGRIASAWARNRRGFREAVAASADPEAPTLPGTGVFVPIAIGICAVGGVIVAILPGGDSFLLTVAAHVTLGAAYGLAARALALRRYLTLPEEI